MAKRFFDKQGEKHRYSLSYIEAFQRSLSENIKVKNGYLFFFHCLYIKKIKKQMKKYKIFTFVLAAFLIHLLTVHTAKADQLIQLFVNDFNDIDQVNNEFNLNSNEAGNNDGINQWIVNDQYNGGNLYPDTPEQDGVSGGDANSPYLHTYNSAYTFSNANYDVNETSDVYALMKASVCTHHLVNVRIAFSYIGGDEYSYMELYYNKDQKGWQSSGQIFSGASEKWKYAEIKDEDFSDAVDLRFGFRFVSEQNNGTGMGFGIDNLQIVADYDEDDPVTITVTSVPEVFCEGEPLSFTFELSDTLCTDNYLIELSNSMGEFPGVANWSSTFQYPITAGTFSLGFPSWIPPGDCYKIRVTKTGSPYIVSEESLCIKIEDCEDTIFTLGPPAVLTDPDDPWIADSTLPSICTGSVIDADFNSMGGFNQENKYILQLSNPDGSWDFGTFWGNIGTIEDSNQYPVEPGSVGGIIPTDAPEGCNYYIRVVSTSPGTIGEAWGPFCIRHCDIETNNMEDITLCISELEGASVNVNVDIHIWDDNADYFEDNNFIVEIRDMKFFMLVNYGDWLKPGNEPGSFVMEVPKLPDLVTNYGLQPGEYYMRIVATSSSETDDLWGTWIHLSIGSPSLEPPVLSAAPETICINDKACISIINPPANPNSTYDWYINDSLEKTYSGTFSTKCWYFDQAGEYSVQVQENNYGCIGPLSLPVKIYVVNPSVTITGPDKLCQGEEVCFNSQFMNNTFYSWDITGAEITSLNNNEVCVKVGDDVDEVTVNLVTTNDCGNVSDFKVYMVEESPLLIKPETQLVCKGEELSFEITTNAENFQLLDPKNNVLVENVQIIVLTPEETGYYTIVAQTPGLCERSETFLITVFDPDAEISISQLGTGNICTGDLVQFEATYYPNTDYSWTTNGVEVISTDNHQISCLALEANILLEVVANNVCGDFDASLSIDCFVGIDGNNDSPAINAYFYPNPAKSNQTTSLFYTIKDKSYKVKLNLYDVTGRKVISETALPTHSNQLNIDLKDMASGMYLFTLSTDDGRILESGKLIVN